MKRLILLIIIAAGVILTNIFMISRSATNTQSTSFVDTRVLQLTPPPSPTYTPMPTIE